MNSSILEDYDQFDGVTDSFQAYGEIIVKTEDKQDEQKQPEKIEYQDFSEMDPSFKIELSRKQSFTTNTQTPAIGQSFVQTQDKLKECKQKLNLKELTDKLSEKVVDQKRKRSVSQENYLQQTRVSLSLI